MVMAVDFLLVGQTFNAINGGADVKFTEAISELVDCESQEEVDEFWAALGEGGDPTPRSHSA